MPKITRLNELEKKGRKVSGRWQLGRKRQASAEAVNVQPGRWQLDKNHRLRYVSDHDPLTGRSEETVTLDTSLVAAEPEALVISVTEKKKNRSVETSLARLTGKWQANENNELEFEVARESGINDVLTFAGAWKLSDSQEIVYSYKGNRRPQTLAFKGFWDISKQNRLTYLFEGSSDSAFRFRGTFQTPSILAKKGELRWQLGAEAEGKKQRLRTVTLFGKWKVSDKLELVFEMEYGNSGPTTKSSAGKRKHAIRFGAEFSPIENYTVSARLVTRDGDPLGVEVVLTRAFMADNIETFLRLKKSLVESSIEGGVRIPW